MSAQITPFPSPDKVIDRRPLHHEATARLRDMIVQGEIAPGARLNERVLCQQLGISRTPLREALKVLAAEGLVELLPNRGAVVTQLTLRAVQEIFEVMGALERLAGELVCRNATEADIAEIRALHYQMMVYYARGDLAGYFRYNQQIHLKLVESTGNATLAATYRNLNAHVRRARYMANLSRERWDKAVQEHEEILDALMKRDSARLQGLLQDHLGHKMLVVLEALNAASAPAQAATP
jgi:DNA-binding GntR family transcriptional regulator